MDSKPNEELISAYLDGELDDAERQRVERWLAESAELRQLCAELRALGASVRALPRHKLDSDLAPAVLRRAEQAVLRSGVEQTRPTVSLASWWSRGAGWRRLAWPAVALAAALLIYVFGIGRTIDQRPLAQRTAEEPAKVAAPASEAPTGAGAALSEQSRDESYRLKVTPQPNAAPAQGALRAAPAMNAAAQQATPSAKPSPGGDVARRLRSNARQMEASDSPTVTCDVSPDFIASRAIEKLFDEQKIVWRLAADQQKSKDAAESTETQTGPPGQYVIELSRDQLDALVRHLRDDSREVARVTFSGDEKQPATAGKSFSVRFVLQPVAVPAKSDE